MSLLIIGLNHRSAPIEVRERVAFANDAQPLALASLRDATHADEALLVSTCNRTELYLRVNDAEADSAAAAAKSWLGRSAQRDLSAHVYEHRAAEAVRHAFRVASGLDSMVLGEPQILGQIKYSTRVAADARTLGGPLNRLLQDTFAVAKEVRSRTEIGAMSTSMAATALKLAQRIFGDLHDCKLLLIGVGEMIELAATHFAAHEPAAIVVANRTLERGEALAAKFNAKAITLRELPERIHEFDAIITSTSSALPIIGKGMVERALKLRKHRPMFMVDLAVPRDIEAEVGSLNDVFLYTLDSLGKVIAQNLAVRESAIVEAEAIIADRSAEFMRWLEARGSVPVIQQLRSRADHYRATELERAQKLLARGEDPAKVIEQLAGALTKKFLHHPLAALNRASGTERDALAEALDKLYPVDATETTGVSDPHKTA